MNRLHPIYHATTYQPGSRIDIERLLPISPGDEDPEDLIDNLSEPPHFLERLAPVRTQIGDEIIRGKNWTDLMIKTYRVYGRMWSRLTMFVHSVLRDSFNERGMLPFLSVCIDPDTFHRIIEMDYEAGENTYGSLMQLFGKGVLSPCVTVPFCVMLPLLDSEFDQRMAIRTGFTFYSRILDRHFRFVQEVHKESDFVVPFWLPENAYSQRTLEILHQEFLRFCKEHDHKNPHLILLLDNAQARTRDHDVLMKSWNTVSVGSGRNSTVSVIFRDRPFSNWVSYANPSVKKLLDRTIAKVDSELNTDKVNYCWSHFEDLETLSFCSKSVVNFEQKMLKLTELGYLPVSPDVYVRRKLNGKFGLAEHEPQRVDLIDKSAGEGWVEGDVSFSRWLGLRSTRNGEKLKSAPNQPYARFVRKGEIEERGTQCWKIAYHEMRRRVLHSVRGNPDKLKGGVLGVLREMLPTKSQAVARRNIESFLNDYAYIYWREHFIQHDLSEADINAFELVNGSLMKKTRGRPTPLQCAVASTAAQAYFFALDGHKSADTRQKNFDQRAVYQNVAMLTLAVCNMIYVHRWRKDAKSEKEMFQLLKCELLDFPNAYKRYELSQYGVTRKDWKESIVSHVEETDLDCVTRAARRVAARHLRSLGYRREFTRQDEGLSTHVGHIWDTEVQNPNYRWENHYFCGVLEE